jgi:Tol biopolymer transport system component
VFSILQDGAWSLAWKAANGTGPVEILYTSENEVHPSSCSPDGKFLIFEDWPSPSNGDIWALSLEGEANAHPLLAEKYYEGAPALSPDGRWMAYGSNESGEYNVYVRPFPNLDDGKWLISTQGGRSR